MIFNNRALFYSKESALILVFPGFLRFETLFSFSIVESLAYEKDSP
ncbi:hypothetical protein BN000_04596 [Neobacillus massiliamazoniensis]|uniref:Uncharacterized protein n=1 Tax=Neobacillus massiliamazoniensis TaxID=1499688 RepID=A0A0U1P341_9BACI|nr:hypothetical protein BN000_04596 [Neobacillus massiliamazoniensis]